MFESILHGGEPSLVALTLYTDAFVIKGSVRSVAMRGKRSENPD